MKCLACGYDDVGDVMRGHRHDRMANGTKPFIELTNIQRGPLHYESQTDGFTTRAVARGFPVTAYACPQCGTVRIEL